MSIIPTGGHSENTNHMKKNIYLMLNSIRCGDHIFFRHFTIVVLFALWLILGIGEIWVLLVNSTMS